VGIPPIRGRADELRVVGELIAAVAQGRGGVLVIEGPPGIGKSRLLTEVFALAEKAGVRALFGEAFEYQQTVPFFSLFMATLRADPPVPARPGTWVTRDRNDRAAQSGHPIRGGTTVGRHYPVC
jgi:predicted ATPase